MVDLELEKLVHITAVPESLRFIRGQPEYMRARGLHSIAITSNEEFGWTDHSHDDIEIRRVKIERRIAPLNDVISMMRLTKVIRQIGPAIVHSHTPKAGLLGMMAATFARVPIRIYGIHGLPYLTATDTHRRMLMTAERASCELADRVFCVSQSVRQVVIEDGICNKDKIVVLAGGSSNGVDAVSQFNPERFSPIDRSILRTELNISADDLVVGYVGRIVKDKGIEELSAAWSRIREDVTNAILLIVGPREEGDPVPEGIIRSLLADPRVRMIGAVRDSSRYYAISDVMVLPSRREGFPNVPLESAAMGLPVVVSDIPGSVDAVVPNVTGKLFPVRDSHALGHAIVSYLQDPELRRNHGQAGRVRVLREFRRDLIWEETYNEYSALLRTKSVPVLDKWER